MINWIKNIFRKKSKFGYSYHSFTIPKYNFEGFDKNKDNFAMIIPKQVTKRPKRKWYQIFKKKQNPPAFHITDNPDGTKTWELK